MQIRKKCFFEECKTQVSAIELNIHRIKSSFSVKILRVAFDEQLTFKKHIKAISNTSMIRLLYLRHVRSHFYKFSFQIIYSTFFPRLDYCNSLLLGLHYSLIVHSVTGCVIYFQNSSTSPLYFMNFNDFLLIAKSNLRKKNILKKYKVTGE